MLYKIIVGKKKMDYILLHIYVYIWLGMIKINF